MRLVQFPMSRDVKVGQEDKGRRESMEVPLTSKVTSVERDLSAEMFSSLMQLRRESTLRARREAKGSMDRMVDGKSRWSMLLRPASPEQSSIVQPLRKRDRNALGKPE